MNEKAKSDAMSMLKEVIPPEIFEKLQDPKMITVTLTACAAALLDGKINVEPFEMDDGNRGALCIAPTAIETYLHPLTMIMASAMRNAVPGISEVSAVTNGRVGMGVLMMEMAVLGAIADEADTNKIRVAQSVIGSIYENLNNVVEKVMTEAAGLNDAN